MLGTSDLIGDLTRAQTAAGLARHRLEEMGGELDAALGLLDRAAHVTDWHSPAADSFHGEIERLRREAFRLRRRVDELAATAAGAGVLLADLAERPP
jgi:hypothetical protein